MKTKLSKNVEVLRPFLRGLGHLVPLRKVKLIRGYRVPHGLNEVAYASIVRYPSRRVFTIHLLIQQHLGKKDYTFCTLERVLSSLAHELAHLRHWEHTPAHFALQAKIMLHFSTKLAKLRIKDHNCNFNRVRIDAIKVR